VQQRLSDCGVSSRLVPNMCSIIPRKANNWKLWLVNLKEIWHLPKLADEIIKFSPDLLHLNYEGFVPLLGLLRRKGFTNPVVLHMRTMSPVNIIYRNYAKIINECVSCLVFISENEQRRACEAGVDLTLIKSAVLYNTVDPAMFDSPIPSRDPAGRLRLIFIGSIDEQKAADRLIDIARILKARQVDASISAYGRSPRYRKWLFFERRNLESLSAKVATEKLDDYLQFYGHVSNPEDRLRQADILLRPSRDNDPWGRDVLEAMAAGVPVMAIGSYDRFVVSGKTGWLFNEWNPNQWVSDIAHIAASPGKLDILALAARSHARELIDPPEYGRRISAIYSSLIDSKI
jgi:glycosyltransferase involved in cell wall biosynthesis